MKVGTRIRIIKSSEGHSFDKKIGKVVRDTANTLGLEFDHRFSGHDCNGFGMYGHCWYFGKTNLIYKIISENKWVGGDRARKIDFYEDLEVL